MKIYAIRDRLIDYWQQPFAGPDDRAVMQAVARGVNSGEATSDIAQAPHHFEIWQLGLVTEDGHLVPERKFICDCASLVRNRVRDQPGPGGAEAPDAVGGGGTPPERPPGNA